MEYDNLQAVADAIIKSNEKLIYVNLIVLFITIACVFLIALFKKSGELTAIKLAFDDIKDQNRVITSETESIKRQLEKGTIEYQIKLSKYHEKKIDAVEKIYSKLAGVLNCSRKILITKDETGFKNFNHALEEFRNNFEAQKLWLDSSISQQINQFALTVGEQVRQFQVSNYFARSSRAPENETDQIYDKYDDFYNFTVKESTNLKEQLEDMLRIYLSPSN